ncbi:hypothetical protein F5883DRAFT_510097 [Diaporthe sp. PMI_573]|nr:hypothetical protein F5883DRAFT_510097 [Diaporthaceae sp. PMI_573]
MTLHKGKRSYRACVRCRQRKTRCDLDGIGEPKKPPCVSCHHSGSDCVLAESSRGGNFRLYKPKCRSQSKSGSSQDLTRSHNATSEELEEATLFSDASANQADEGIQDDNLDGELRNPSDALHILAQAEGVDRPRPQTRSLTRGNGQTDSTSPCLKGHGIYEARLKELIDGESPTPVLDDYDLIKQGRLGRNQVVELLSRYSKLYHPFCPIAPGYLIGQSGLQRLQESDHFLLTVILAIASRDRSIDLDTHNTCWQHIQRLLLDVLLARPWTLNPQTVEGLLLLSEWLPHTEVDHENSLAYDHDSLSDDDRTAWSLIGLAVRHGYMLHLDQGAFRQSTSTGTTEQMDRNRLIWTFVYVADRQISVRLGQSFWSRGPSLSAHFTAKDFNSLQPVAGWNQEDYSSVMHATIELTHILHNAHAILYSSKDRTLSMVRNGDYARYIDDFRISASAWHSRWANITVSCKIKDSLLLLYEYLCLYVNIFSFQAVMSRSSAPYRTPDRERTSEPPLVTPFACGIMSTPDGRYVLDAITAALNILQILKGFATRDELRYLPSRYYLYGVYAAVFLKKAAGAGSLHSDEQIQKTTDLTIRFTDAMEQAASHNSQIGSKCSRMLKRLWHPRKQQAKANVSASAQLRPKSARQSKSGESETSHSGHQGTVDRIRSGEERFAGEGGLLSLNTVDLGQPASTAIDLDESLFESFMLDFDFLGGGNFQDLTCAPLSSFEWEPGQI